MASLSTWTPFIKEITMAKEIKVKCDHCGKDVTCDIRYRININITKQISAKEIATGMIPYGPGENYEIDLCAKCYRVLNTQLAEKLKQGEQYGQNFSINA